MFSKVQQQCLKRGGHGIKSFGRMFRIMDDNRDGNISLAVGMGLRSAQQLGIGGV